MNNFFLLVEIFKYAFAFYLLVKKGELAVVYIPVLIFAHNLINPVFSALLYYGAVSAVLLGCIARNPSFFKSNVFAFLLVVYFLILLPRSTDLVLIRPMVFGVFWFFISVALIPAIYRKYDEASIFKEASNSAIIILCLFLLNVLFSSIYRFAPFAMYGITKGVLYGNLFGSGFNIVAVAVFLAVLRFIDKRNVIDLIILCLSVLALLLSLRRSVMVISCLGILVAMISLLTRKDVKKFIVYTSLVAAIGYFVYTNTGFSHMFEERYEMRKLDDRDLDEEKRFIEYELLYKDMFVHHDYSPWFGYELFNSAGNYGRGAFAQRTLHGDIPSIVHSSGLLGLLLYLLMVGAAFWQTFKARRTMLDKLILLFSLVTFAVFTGTGRFTEAGSMILIFVALYLPLARPLASTEAKEQSGVLMPEPVYSLN